MELEQHTSNVSVEGSSPSRNTGVVAQMARAVALEAKGREFESHQRRFYNI